MVQSFYPSNQRSNQPQPYRPETLLRGLVDNVTALQHAELNATYKPNILCPLIIFIPGLGHGRQDYTILCEELASHGFIVLALDQPYVTNFVRFIDGTTCVPTFYDLWKVSRDRDYRYNYYDEAMDAAIADIRFLLNNLDTINRQHCANSLDKKRIAIMGHSFGGNVAHTIGFEDKHIRAVVDIDSKITERPIHGTIGVPTNNAEKPVLFIRGMLQYQEANIIDQLNAISHSTVWAPEVEHSAFSDNVFLAQKIPSLKNKGLVSKIWNWFFKRGPFFDIVDCSTGSYSLDEWITEYRKQVTAYLNKTLEHHDDF